MQPTETTTLFWLTARLEGFGEAIINLERTRSYVLAHLFLTAVIALSYSPALDNALAGDDYDWVSDGLLTIHQPSQFLATVNCFVRPAQRLYFVINCLVWGTDAGSFFATMVMIHLATSILVSLLICQMILLYRPAIEGGLSSARAAGLFGALLWALNYKHSEAILRPYTVADPLALFFSLGALLFFLHRRPRWAALTLVFALFSKETALLMPAIATFSALGRGRTWLVRTIPMWILALAHAGLLVVVRSNCPSYHTADLTIISRLWDNLLSLVGPDAVYLKQVYFDGRELLTPLWLAIVLSCALLAALWKTRGVVRFGLVWICLTILPTVTIPFQTSRYQYMPQVGVAILLAVALQRTVEWSRARRSLAGEAVAWLAAVVLLSYLALGLQLEERDNDRFGEIHRQAEQSFLANILPNLPEDPDTVVVFLKTPTMDLSQEIFPQRAWYLPGNYKWIFRRPFGILGLASTGPFVTICSHGIREPFFFAPVSQEEFREQVSKGNFVVVLHDSQRNVFSFGDRFARSEVKKAMEEKDLYRVFQPGRFDPTVSIRQYY